MNFNITKEQVEEAIKISNSWSSLAYNLKYKKTCGSMGKKWVKKYNLNFIPTKKGGANNKSKNITKEQVEEAIKISNNWNNLANNLGYKNNSSSRAKHWVNKYNLTFISIKDDIKNITKEQVEEAIKISNNWSSLAHNLKYKGSYCRIARKWVEKYNLTFIPTKKTGQTGQTGRPRKFYEYEYEIIDEIYVRFKLDPTLKNTTDEWIYVDLEDWDNVKKWNWNIQIESKNYRTINTRINQKHIGLHQFVFDKKENLVIDHIDHNTLNNTKENLRNIPMIINSILQIHKDRLSKYRGVCKNKYKFVAYICYNGKNKHLGCFEDEIEAAKTYNKALYDRLCSLEKNEKNIKYLKYYDECCNKFI